MTTEDNMVTLTNSTNMGLAGVPGVDKSKRSSNIISGSSKNDPNGLCVMEIWTWSRKR